MKKKRTYTPAPQMEKGKLVTKTLGAQINPYKTTSIENREKQTQIKKTINKLLKKIWG